MFRLILYDEDITKKLILQFHVEDILKKLILRNFM